MKDFLQYLPVDLVMHIFNAVLIFVIVRFLIYKPVSRYMKKRNEMIHSQIEEANKLKTDADKALHEYEDKLRNSESQAVEIIRTGEEKANVAAQAILDDAKKKAGIMVDSARNQIDIERKASIEKLREDISLLAIDIAQKILQREVRAEDNQLIIDEFFSKEYQS